ncbi:MAG: hypothetical protein IJI41_10550 [Anaerolineaceae bacterium]|nr:hypothetical protein [Anaerolineaceae bacterium]
MQRLLTEAGAGLSGIPWNRYPRPQMVRDEWLCLNGIWKLTSGNRTSEILVPFCPESLLSGMEWIPEYGKEMVYERSFSIPKNWDGKRILLHFGAVSRVSDVSVNGKKVLHHEESYLPFCADITDALIPGNNTLSVIVVNDISHRHPWGKQKIDRGGMWYTPVSGIWQTVWLEPVPEQYIHSLSIRTGLDQVQIRISGVDSGTLTLDGETYPFKNGSIMISLKNPRHWSPEDPFLYHFEIRCGEDSIHSYFALRTLSTEIVKGIPRLCLNGKPYFFHGFLDQGYWSDGLYTPADSHGFEQDIKAMKALGFNTLRKHIKIEPEQFYYDCDRLGMIVFQDMVNCGEYRYIRDTVLPTIGLLRKDDRNLTRDEETRANFLSAMEKTVLLLDNHPCICLWTIFNEGWGQFCADDVYDKLKSLDDSRFIDSTSGWFHQKKSDVDSLHIYFQKLHTGKENLPMLLSEIGGWSCKIPEHSFNQEKTYGYRKYKDRKEFVRDLRALYLEQVLPLIPKGLCGTVYTQVSDVEDETNGLLTFDRRAAKILPEEFADIARILQNAGM